MSSWHPLARWVAPGAFAAGVAGAHFHPHFLAGRQARELEPAFLARVGQLPAGVGRVGVAGGVADFVVFHDAGLAVALAGEFAFFVAHGEFEAGRGVGHGLGAGRAFHAQFGGIHLGLGGGELADIGAEDDELGFHAFLRLVAGRGRGFRRRLRGGLESLLVLEQGDGGVEGGELGGEAGEDGLAGDAGADVFGPLDELRVGEVGQVEDDVEHRFGLGVEDFLEGAGIVKSDQRIVKVDAGFVEIWHGRDFFGGPRKKGEPVAFQQWLSGDGKPFFWEKLAVRCSACRGHRSGRPAERTGAVARQPGGPNERRSGRGRYLLWGSSVKRDRIFSFYRRESGFLGPGSGFLYTGSGFRHPAGCGLDPGRRLLASADGSLGPGDGFPDGEFDLAPAVVVL